MIEGMSGKQKYIFFCSQPVVGHILREGVELMASDW